MPGAVENNPYARGLRFLMDKYIQLMENKNVNDALNAYDQATKGSPIGLGDEALRLPQMLAVMPVAKMSSKLREGFRKLYKTNVENMPLLRYQQEAVDFPVTQGARGGLFASYGKDFQGYHTPSISAAEGGAHKIKFDYTPKNPLILKKDAEFLGPATIERFEPSRLEKDPTGIWETDLNPIKRAIQNTAPSKWDKSRTLLKYATPKELKAAAESRDPHTQIQELIGFNMARKHGYDSIVSMRKKTVPAEYKNYFREKFNSYALPNENRMMSDYLTTASNALYKKYLKDNPTSTIEQLAPKVMAATNNHMGRYYALDKSPYVSAAKKINAHFDANMHRYMTPERSVWYPTQAVVLDKDFIKSNLRKFQTINPPQTSIANDMAMASDPDYYSITGTDITDLNIPELSYEEFQKTWDEMLEATKDLKINTKKVLK